MRIVLGRLRCSPYHLVVRKGVRYKDTRCSKRHGKYIMHTNSLQLCLCQATAGAQRPIPNHGIQEPPHQRTATFKAYRKSHSSTHTPPSPRKKFGLFLLSQEMLITISTDRTTGTQGRDFTILLRIYGVRSSMC